MTRKVTSSAVPVWALPSLLYLAAILTLSLPGPASGEGTAILAWEEAGQSARLHHAAVHYVAPPVVVILLYALQHDLCHARYAEYFLALGFAVLLPESEPVETVWLLARIRHSQDLDGKRVGFLASGAGAALAVTAVEIQRGLLYPGCATLGVEHDAAPLLIMQGDLIPANAITECLEASPAPEAAGVGMTRSSRRSAPSPTPGPPMAIAASQRS